MIRAGFFLSTTERAELTELARNGLVEHRLARRANALVLLDQGMSFSDVGAALFLDDDTVRTWFRLYREEGIEGLAGFIYEGSDCHLNARHLEKLKSWIAETLSGDAADPCVPGQRPLPSRRTTKIRQNRGKCCDTVGFPAYSSG